MEDNYASRFEEMRAQRAATFQQIRNNLFYIIIFIASMLVLIFVPMIGSDAPEIKKMLPKNSGEWAVYITTKLCVSTLNLVIFISFTKQGKLNVRNEKSFIEANEILMKVKPSKKYRPLSPREWQGKVYSTKGISLFVSSALGLVSFSFAMIKYDWMALISYAVVIVMGIIFGLMQMYKSEEYWTIEYYQYALYIKNKQEQNKESEVLTDDNSKQSNTKELTRTSTSE